MGSAGTRAAYGTLDYGPTRERWYTGPSIQKHPELFTRAAIMSEVRHLMRLNRTSGQPDSNGNAMRTAVYSRLLKFIADTDRGLV